MLVRISFRQEGRGAVARIIIQYLGTGSMHEASTVFVDDSPLLPDGETHYYLEALRVVIRGGEAYVYTK